VPSTNNHHVLHSSRKTFIFGLGEQRKGLVKNVDTAKDSSYLVPREEAGGADDLNP
jgi:hypothetical protein